ncbi:MAG: hypothetical protein AB4038_13130 [Prochloraceae cyanobacterium]
MVLMGLVVFYGLDLLAQINKTGLFDRLINVHHHILIVVRLIVRSSALVQQDFLDIDCAAASR